MARRKCFISTGFAFLVATVLGNNWDKCPASKEGKLEFVLGSVWEWSGNFPEEDLARHPVETDGYCDYFFGSSECELERHKISKAVVLDNFRDSNVELEKRIESFGGVSRVAFWSDAVRKHPRHGTEDALTTLVREVLPCKGESSCVPDENGRNQERFEILKSGRHEMFLCRDKCTKFWSQKKENKSLYSAGTMWYVTIRSAIRGLVRLAIFVEERTDIAFLFQYTLQIEPDQSFNTLVKEAQNTKGSKLKVVTYNVWNTMPHLGKEWSYAKRMERYLARMDHLTKFIKEANADIVALQEIRFDQTLQPDASPSQLENILDRLKENMTYKYFVFQPAMAFISNRGNFEGAEGVAILSRHPIVDSRYLMLSRVFGSPLDFHQRIALHARVLVHDVGLVDVFTSHLSLERDSRMKSVNDILAFADGEKTRHPELLPVAQFILGDFNDEPNSEVMKALNTGLRKSRIETNESCMEPNKLGGIGFRDLWLELKQEPWPRSRRAEDVNEAFTFPSDEPKKRIDYIFFRGVPSQETLMPETVQLLGQRPATSQGASTSSKIGMESPQSLLWASDHRAILGTFMVRPEIDYVLPRLTISNSCTVRVEGKEHGVKKWQAEFFLGAFSADDFGGFRDRGAVDNSAEFVSVNGIEVRCCSVLLFDRSDYEGVSLELGPGEHWLSQRGWANLVSAIVVRYSCV